MLKTLKNAIQWAFIVGLFTLFPPLGGVLFLAWLFS